MRRASQLSPPPPDAELTPAALFKHGLESVRFALIRFASPCQVHPLVAQSWTGRLRDRIVLAANTGFRSGWVHFAARSAAEVDLATFLAAHAPPGADELYGSGHRHATGGALRPPGWNAFVRGLGFGAEMEVPA